MNNRLLTIVAFLGFGGLNAGAEDFLTQQTEYLSEVRAYNPVKNELDKYLAHHFDRSSVYIEMARKFGLPIAKDVSFESLIRSLTGSVSSQINSDQAVQLVWDGSKVSGGDFGHYFADDQMRATTEAERMVSVKKLDVFPIFDASKFLPNSLNGLRHVTLEVQVGAEYGIFFKEIAMKVVSLALVEHPVSKEIFVMINHKPICQNCEATYVKSVELSENRMTIEAIDSVWGKSSRDSDQRILFHHNHKFEILLNAALDLRYFQSAAFARLAEANAYPTVEVLYSTGGKPQVVLPPN